MICPFDYRECRVPRCAVCPLTALIAAFGPDSGFSESQIRAGLTVPATEDEGGETR